MKLDARTHCLVVEGPDDVHVVATLIQRERPQIGAEWPRPPNDRFISAAHAKAGDLDGAVGAAIREFFAIVAIEKQPRVGLILDADADPTARWATVTKELKTLGLDGVPTEPQPAGYIVQRERTRIGIWLWPDNVSAGTLETLLWDLVPSDSLKTHALDATAIAKAKGAPFTDASTTKAKFRAWLAWQEQPGLPPGQAIARRVVSGNTDAVDRFTTWFEALFLKD